MHRLGLKLWNAPQWAIALGSGLLMACAPEPLNLWGLAWIALIPFWVLVVSTPVQNRKCTLLYATLWGMGYHGIAISWITGLHPLTWLGMSWITSVIVTAFCWVFITLWGTATTVLWAWGMGRISRLQGITAWVRVLAGTALWCSLEWLLTLTPLNWTSLSYTQSPGNLWAVHLGQLSGPLTVTAAIVACNGLLAEAWMQWRNRADRLRPLLLSALVLVISVHGLGAWLASRPLQDVDAAKLTIGMIQGNVPTRIKLSAEGGRRAIASYNRGYLELANQQVDAVLTPEGAIPFLWDVYRETSSSITRAIATERIPAWLGTFVSQGTTYTQSLLSLDQQGVIVGRYDKIKLVPLGEYIPLRSILGGLIDRLSPIEAVMIPGSEHQQFETPFGRAIGSICYESAYPNYFRAQAAQGGQFILTASNLDPYSEVLMMQHQAHDIMRAIETDRWVARATNTGYSGFVDPHGRVVWRSHPLTYETHAETIYRRQTQTLYVRWGNWLTPVLILGAIGMIGLAIVRPA
ncbi:MAG: apolipoprotein N-acyltransferase [Synechococcales cyanobacterium T60_A2020_003]|nr:apolipoprotein N-acyltransferase [Synechococcales cyanobacterium T60_A2020_003]